ncbi:unnamed protein product [Cylindrotheca closterium]|uniref:Uncharacterized protein n=1 Tax=Cylindrotheca closterium TaxID=2856 RepID=A0AAD2CMQ4_9STRA|nr:unnamed protein product [Cylindrotheca closterium]
MNHQSNKNLSTKTRCSSGIQERIDALQKSSGCHHHHQQENQTRPSGRVSKRPSLNLSDLQHSIYSMENSVSSLDLSNSIQLPLTPGGVVDENAEEQQPTRTNTAQRSVSFANMADVCFIPQLDDTVDYGVLYYKEDELADFRHEAFLEDCGLADMMM